MFKILDGREHFYQWDIDRKLIVEDRTVSEVHFCNKTGECSLVCKTYEQDELWVVDVPNILLQDTWRVNVYAYDGSYTLHSAFFTISARTKPESYVYTETETLNYNSLVERIEYLEANIGGGGADDDDDDDGGVTPARYIVDVTTEPARDFQQQEKGTWTITTWSDGTREAELITDVEVTFYNYEDRNKHPVYIYSCNFPEAQRIFPTGFTVQDTTVEVSVVNYSIYDGRVIIPRFSKQGYDIGHSVSLDQFTIIYNYFDMTDGETLTVTCKVKATTVDNTQSLFIMGRASNNTEPAKYITDVTTEPACNFAGEIGDTWTITTWSDGTREAELITSLVLVPDGTEPPVMFFYNEESFPHVQRILPAGFDKNDIIEVSIVNNNINNGCTVIPAFNTYSGYRDYNDSVSLSQYYPTITMYKLDMEQRLSITLKIRVTKA